MNAAHHGETDPSVDQKFLSTLVSDAMVFVGKGGDTGVDHTSVQLLSLLDSNETQN